MTGFTVNTHVTSTQPPAEGRHRFRIETMQVKEMGPSSQTPGAPYLNARLRVISNTAGAQGKSVFQNFNLDGSFRYLFEQLCQALDVAGRDDFDIGNFVGGEFEAELVHEEYNGEKRGKLKRIYIEESDEALTTGAGTPKQNFPF